jgi:1-deoxy-D-xylulose-5-phosphate reductoisomerase
MKSVVILGSTGSVGKQTLQVIRGLKNQFNIMGLSARDNWQLLGQQIKEFKPRYAVMIDATAAERLQIYLKQHRLKTQLFIGLGSIKKLVTQPTVKLVFSAIAGADGLYPSIWALEHGKNLALANKESMVMAGPLLLKLARKHGAEIIPVDSEHSAIFQALRSGHHSEVNRIILTASGGPFYKLTSAQLHQVKAKEALRHPVWAMGTKITIDSATLMNKALEIIEAKWLFNLKPDQIKVVLHPQSIIHSMVEFHDGSIIAQLSPPDMRFPIQFALTYPARINNRANKYLFNKDLSLNFITPDFNRFPALKLGYQVAKLGGTTGAVLNAANEEAVKLFINGKITLPNIITLTETILDKHCIIPNPTLTEIAIADNWARNKIRQLTAEPN